MLSLLLALRTRSRGVLHAFVAVSLLAGCGGDDAPAVGMLSATVAKWSRFEAMLARPVEAHNPFDAAEVAVSAEFRSPRGVLYVVDGFVWRDFARQLQDGFEKLAPTGDLRWKIRFAPPEEGEWTWRWRVSEGGRDNVGEWSRLRVGPPAADEHGVVRVSARDPRYLELDDGTPFFAVGENLAWYDGRGTYAYDEWIERLAAQRCNYIRLWMPSWAFGLEWITRDAHGGVANSSLGNYAERLDRAWQLDYVIDLARRRGIYVMLTIQNHGAFSLTNNSEWQDNPYNAANGGPLRTPREFFTNPEAVRLFQRRLRYIVARWGYATNIMAWELWNEVDLVEQPAVDDLVAWHRDMAREIDRLDPQHRLVSTSTSQADVMGGYSAAAALWALAEMDVVQAHFYSFDGAGTDFTRTFPRIVAGQRRFGKPVLVAEAGVDFRGPDETLRADPQADGFHDILWSAVLAGSFGSGMSWWWDNVVDPQNLYTHFGPLADFVAGVDVPAEQFASRTAAGTAPDGRRLRAMLLLGRTTVLVWIKNARHVWYSPDPAPVVGAQLRLEGFEAAQWVPSWFDTRSGAHTPGLPVRPVDGVVDLDVPTFGRDVAVRFNRIEGPPP